MHARNAFFWSETYICFAQSWDLYNLRIVPEEIVVGDMCKVEINVM